MDYFIVSLFDDCRALLNWLTIDFVMKVAERETFIELYWYRSVKKLAISLVGLENKWCYNPE